MGGSPPISFLISFFAVEGIVVDNPVLNIERRELVLGVPDYNALNARVDYHTLAHSAGVGVFDILICTELLADKVHCGAYHLVARSVDDGVSLSVNTAAQLIAGASLHIHLFTDTSTQIGAVLSSSGSAYIARGYNLVILYDNSAVIAANTCTALKYGLGYIKIIVFFINSWHKFHLLYDINII